MSEPGGKEKNVNGSSNNKAKHTLDNYFIAKKET